MRYRFRGLPRKVTLEGFPSLAIAHKLAQAELDKLGRAQPGGGKERGPRGRCR